MLLDLEDILIMFDQASLAAWGPFGLLILCGIGLPVPEDIILVSAGFLAADNGKPLIPTAALMYIGILIGDAMIFSFGRRFGRKVLQTSIGARLMTADRLGRVEGLFKRYGAGVLFVGRYLPGLRAPIYLTAGSIGYSFWRFILLDGLAALISAPLFVWLGHYAWVKFQDDILMVEKAVGRTAIYLILCALILGVIVFFVQRARHKKARGSK